MTTILSCEEVIGFHFGPIEIVKNWMDPRI